MAHLHYPILQATAALLPSLGFTYNGLPATIQILKEPVTRDQLPDLPKLCVCPCQGDGRKRWFLGGWDVWYGVQVALVATGNLDLVTNLPTWLGWRGRVIDALQDPLALRVPDPTLTSIWQVDILPDDPLDRGLIPQGLDFSSVRFRFHTIQDDT